MTNTDNSREWAEQAYALLKKQQEEKKQELQKQEEKKQELQKQESFDTASQENPFGVPKNIAEPKLGEFDDNFTWSAMMLA